jgi:hypothetical protein
MACMQNDSVGAKKRASATIGRPMCWCSVHHFIEAILPGDASYVGTSFVGSNHAVDWDVLVVEGEICCRVLW